MIVTKKKGTIFDQKHYDLFFNSIEYDLRELGFGDVSVNSKMKEFNKILYDILLKIEINNKSDLNSFTMNHKLVEKYFDSLKAGENSKIDHFEAYFRKFYNFCFDQSPKNMLKELKNFKF